VSNIRVETTTGPREHKFIATSFIVVSGGEMPLFDMDHMFFVDS